MMDLIVSWLCSAIANAFEAFTNFFTDIFGYDITVFNQTFGFAATAYDVIRNTALALALILAAWQVINFFTKGAEASTTPVRATLNAVLAIGFIFYGNYLLELILDFCQYPFDSLLLLNSVDGKLHLNLSITNYVSSAFAEVSILLYLIMLLLICFSFVKLLLEIVERYVVTFVLLYLSPLASATLASSNTNGIFKKFLTMFISQCILLFLNVWCLKMACSALDLDQYLTNGGGSLVIPLLLCYAFLRISSKMDSYINQLGLNAAITGGGLGAEILATGASIMGVGKNGHGGGSDGGNKILGAAKTAATYVRRYDPIAGIANTAKGAVVGAGQGFSEAYRSGGGIKNAFTKEGAKAMAAGAGQGFASGLKNSDNLVSNLANSSTPIQKIVDLTPRKAGESAPQVKLGYRENLNKQLVEGLPIPSLPMDYDSMSEDQQKVAKSNFDSARAAYNNNVERNIDAWSKNEHLAHAGFAHVQNENKTIHASGVGEESQRIMAVAKGLGMDKQSNEAAEFVKVGMGTADGVADGSAEFTMDRTGIHGKYDKDGYRHKVDFINQSQFDNLPAAQREGFEKSRIVDGHRYYTRTTKTKIDATPPQSRNTSRSIDKDGNVVKHTSISPKEFSNLNEEEKKRFTEHFDEKGKPTHYTRNDVDTDWYDSKPEPSSPKK